MSSNRAGQRGGARRGLGRGLGSLIPTGPAHETPKADESADTHAAAAADSRWPSGQDAATRTGDRHQSEEPGNPEGAGTEIEDERAAGAAGQVPGGAASVPMPVGVYFAELPPEQIRPNAVQPRTVFDQDAMAELVHSIREVGLLQPVVVRRIGPERYELVMGERRWRAAQEAGLDAVPAIVRPTGDDDMLRDALLENLHRAQLNPLEEASAYAQLLEDFGCTHEELADRIGRSRPQITNTIRLLKLSPPVQRRVAAGVLSAGHARSLLGVQDPDQQDRLARRVVAEGISVRGLEELVAVGDLGPEGPDGSGVDLRRQVAKPVAPGLVGIAERLGDRLETRVKVDLGKTKGKVTIEFATLDDLRRITDVIDPRNRIDKPI